MQMRSRMRFAWHPRWRRAISTGILRRVWRRFRNATTRQRLLPLRKLPRPMRLNKKVFQSLMTTSLAFLFPGQGSQAVGMGKELAERYPIARQTFEEADAALGISLSPLCFEGPDEELRRTEITQPSSLTVSVATLRVLAEQ